MNQLLHDRFFRYSAEHAWDLVTGESVAISDITENTAPSLPVSEPLMEVLDHGREGEPRWVVVEADSGQSSRTFSERASADARARGVVPIAVDVYLRLQPLVEPQLRHRTLMLILHPDVRLELGRRAILQAAACSPRPHVLVSLAGRQPSRRDRGGLVVREARAVYGADVPRGAAARTELPDEVMKLLRRAERWAAFCNEGRHAAAERLLRDVSGALVRRAALVPAAGTLTCLGRLLLERGRAGDAESAFAEAAGHARTACDEPAELRARVWQAAARTDLARLSAAESICRAVLVGGALETAERARAEATLARILLWQGRVEEAAARDLGIETDQDDVAAFVGATAVRVLLARGDVFAAGQRARQTLARADGGHPSLEQVIALTAHARVLMASGDLVMAEQRLGDLRDAGRRARTPLRLVRARLAWVDALRRAGRTTDAEREMRDLQRVRGVSPPLLREAIERRLRGETPPATGSGAGRAIPAVAVALVEIGRDEDVDREAVRRLLSSAGEVLQSSRVDMWSADAGPDTIVSSVGLGLATVLGPRVLETGIVIESRPDGGGSEMGVPVRLGSRLVAALVARWPADRAVPAGARSILELTAAVAAARVDGMQAAAREVASSSMAMPELVGPSAAIAEVRRAVARAAAAPFAVLIEGESGVGKELVARALHQASPRRERPFCDLNCAALPDELLESELFGHMRGAFTGAVVDRPGLFEQADGGTLFLDEVADLSPRAQAKLLRVVQQQEVRRVGASFSRKVDVRIVSAANRDMRAAVTEGRFRQDLLYRLDVVRIHVPPLRDRPEDVVVLARHFWQTAAARVGTRAVLSQGLLATLARYHWPGNVRELQNVVSTLAVAAPSRGQVRARLLPSILTRSAASPTTQLRTACAQFERRFIEVALARANGCRSRTARELGVSRQGLLKMMTRLGVGGAPLGARAPFRYNPGSGEALADSEEVPRP
jgi:DNA-binding NtrC family response regulator